MRAPSSALEYEQDVFRAVEKDYVFARESEPRIDEAILMQTQGIAKGLLSGSAGGDGF